MVSMLSEIPKKKLHGLAKKNRITTKDALINHLVKQGLTEKQANAQLNKGIKVEVEHTDNLEIAAIIAADHLVEFPTYYTALAKMESQLGAGKNKEKKVNRAVVEPLYFQPIPHGLLFNYENVKTTIENEGLSIVDATWEPDTDKKIHEIKIIIEPKNVNKMKKIEGLIDDNIQASKADKSGTRSIIVQATPSGDLLFIVENGISRVYMEEDEDIGI